MCGAITSTVRTPLYRAQGQIYFSSERTAQKEVSFDTRRISGEVRHFQTT